MERDAQAAKDGQPPPPYLLFLGDVPLQPMAKTAAGLLQWRRELCVGKLTLPGCAVAMDIPEMTPAQAAEAGARTLVIAVVNPGGTLPDAWIPTLVEALEAGLNIASGAHVSLSAFPSLRETAARLQRALYDVRLPKMTFDVGDGVKRVGKRILTVGTDCVVGKKYTALALEKALRERGVDADFRATGQTGILIARRGVAIDAVTSDFISGAAEWLSPANAPDHWDVIEGQGSLHHPSFAGVTLGLIHGSQPDALIVCHEPIRRQLLSLPYPIPPLKEFMKANLDAARLTNPNAIIAGMSLNTSKMSAQSAEQAVAAMEKETGLPCCDPIRHGAGKIADYLISVLA